MKAFGTFSPTTKIAKKISWCHRLPGNWFGKQVAQLLRKQVLKESQLPLDLVIEQVKIRCFLKDNISERGFVFMPWRWDTIERQVMLDSLPAEGVMLDIGANVGIYAALATTRLSRLGTVVAIEPNPNIHERLNFNLNATTENMVEKPRVEVLKKGVSNCNGHFELYLDDQNLGASSLIQHPNKKQSVQVSCVTLLSLLEELKLSRVDVIKCDIEGAEDQALIPFLMEAPQHLLPQCIIFENNQDQWQGDLLEALNHRDYIQSHHTRMNFIYQLQQTKPIIKTNAPLKHAALNLDSSG